jgi:NitT/TauT family transport system permease protein
MAAFLLLWEIASRANLISQLFFPPPTVIGNSLLRLIANGQLAKNLAQTLTRLSLGLFLGGSTGMLLGLILGWSPVIRSVAEPFVAALHPLPKIALLPLVLIIFGIGEQSKVVLIGLAAFFPMLINAMVGVQQIEGIYWDVAANYGARKFNLLRRVLLPGSMPYLLAGLRLALNAALVVTVAVEQLTARQGLGANIWLAWETLRTEELYATLLVIAVIGLSANWIMSLLTKKLVPWQVE